MLTLHDPTDDSIAYSSACELKEEAKIAVPVDVMEQCFIGKSDFTFEGKNDVEMLVHLFHVEVKCLDSSKISESVADDDRTTVLIRANEIKPPSDGEITPKWFDNWYEIPLHIMHADDSIWLPKVLLATSQGIKFNGWFHFVPGGPAVNSIQHFHLHHYL